MRPPTSAAAPPRSAMTTAQRQRFHRPCAVDRDRPGRGRRRPGPSHHGGGAAADRHGPPVSACGCRRSQTRPNSPRRAPGAGTPLPAIARYWWLTALRGWSPWPCVGHHGGQPQHRPPDHLPGPVLDDRRAHHAPFALAIRPRPGFRLGLAAATAAVVGAALVLLRDDRLSGVVDPNVFVGLLGISRCSQACCGSWAGSPPRSGWDAAGPSAGSSSAPWSSGSAPCCC